MGKQSPGEFELLVLLAVLRLDGEDAYAVGIVDEIRARTGRKVRRPAVYTALRRLEDKGWVESWMGDPRPERGGKARRLVRVTASGADAVREARNALQAMWSGVSVLGGGA